MCNKYNVYHNILCNHICSTYSSDFIGILFYYVCTVGYSKKLCSMQFKLRYYIHLNSFHVYFNTLIPKTTFL